MKKTLSYIYAMMLMIGISSCSEFYADSSTKDIKNEDGGRTFTFTASKSAITSSENGGVTSRTHLNPMNNAVYWTCNATHQDKINVWAGSSNAAGDLFTAIDGDSESTCHFQCNNATITSKDAYALYPYNKDAKLADNHIITRLEPSQRAIPNSFDPDCALMVSATNLANSTNLSFAHACAFIKVTTLMPCTQIAFCTGDGNKIAAGSVSINLTTHKACVVSADQGSQFVVLTPTNNGIIEPGTYYIAVSPTNYASGYSIQITGLDSGNTQHEKSEAVLTYPAKEMEPGKIYNTGTFAWNTPWTFGNIDLGTPDAVRWQTHNIGSAHATNVGYYYQWGWDHYIKDNIEESTQNPDFKNFGLKYYSIDANNKIQTINMKTPEATTAYGSGFANDSYNYDGNYNTSYYQASDGTYPTLLDNDDPVRNHPAYSKNSNMRSPSIDELRHLFNNDGKNTEYTHIEFTTNYIYTQPSGYTASSSVPGVIIYRTRTDNTYNPQLHEHIFIPAIGYIDGIVRNKYKSGVYLWSNTGAASTTGLGYMFVKNDDGTYTSKDAWVQRYLGYQIRPVTVKQ